MQHTDISLGHGGFDSYSGGKHFLFPWEDNISANTIPGKGSGSGAEDCDDDFGNGGSGSSKGY